MRLHLVRLCSAQLAFMRQAAGCEARIACVAAVERRQRWRLQPAAACQPSSCLPAAAGWAEGTTQQAIMRRAMSAAASASSDAAAGAAAPAAQPPSSPSPRRGTPAPPDPATIKDLPAKLALLEHHCNVPPDVALQRFTPFLCSPAHHVAVRLGFLAARGKLRRLPQTPRLFEVICPSDAELCRLHGESTDDLAAFKAQHLASAEWRRFCRVHGVVQAQPEAPPQQQLEGQQQGQQQQQGLKG